MALSEGTNYTPPKPPKPANSGTYGAPSGPYATPSPYGGSGSIPSLSYPSAPPPALQTRFGIMPTPQPHNALEEWYKEQGSLVRGGRPADPTTGSVGDRLKFAAGLVSMMPIGPGPEIAGVKAAGQAPKLLPRIMEMVAGMRDGSNAGRAASYPTGVAPASKYPLQSMGQMAKFGPEVQRQRQVMDAPSMAEHLAQMANINRTVGTKGVTRAQGSTHTKKPNLNPMEGKFFGYTGSPTHIDPQKHVDELQSRLEGMTGYPAEALGRSREPAWTDDEAQFNDLYDEFLDSMDAADFPRPGGIHNVSDKRGNVLGSLTYDKSPNAMEVHEAYLRPEARGNAGLLRQLLQPIMDVSPQTPIHGMAANPDLARLADRLHKKGRITMGSMGRGYESYGAAAEKGPNGLYPFESADFLPALGDFRNFASKVNWRPR